MSKLKRDWVLPKPPVGPEIIWYPVVRVGRTVPFGYYQDEDPDILQPIPDELDALEKAKTYLQEYSYREVAEWLTKETDRDISHVGLMKRVKIEQKRKREASVQRHYEQIAKEAGEKAEAIEATIGGSSTRETYHPEDCSCDSCT